jgi:hypothetical protein
MDPIPNVTVVVPAGKTELASNDAQTLPDAVVWAGQAMAIYGVSADQVAILKPQLVRHLHLPSEVIVRVAIQGWCRDGAGWRAVPPDSVVVEMDEIRPADSLPPELASASPVAADEGLAVSVGELTAAIRGLTALITVLIPGGGVRGPDN